MKYLVINDLFSFVTFPDRLNISSLESLKTSFNNIVPTLAFSDDEIMEVTYTFIRYHLYPRYERSYATRYDDEATSQYPTGKEGALTSWFRHFSSYLRQSQERYGNLAKIYKEQLANLMKQVETKEGNSDMPQSSSLSDLSSTSQVDVLSSARVRLADGGTTMERLKEIEENLDSIYDEWCVDFYNHCILM